MVNYYEGEPSTYVIRNRAGRPEKHGRGLDAWYLPCNTSIGMVPVVSQDA